MKTYFFTGFPGFIAKELVKEIALSPSDEQKTFYFLVLESQFEAAQKTISDLKQITFDHVHYEVITGDITTPSLFKEKQELHHIDYVFHLAAIYDLAVPFETAYLVNVLGTKHVNEWVKSLSDLKRYVYFSTAYVSGKREGIIYESELDKNQEFKNHYESTKFEAELLVNDLKDTVPTTIIRPGIVRGNSETGATTKFDGPYFILNMFDRLSFLPVIPYLGSGEADGNFVPVDYVIKATAYLSHAEIGEGKTYHLTDPAPLPMKEIYRMLMVEYLGRRPLGKVPLRPVTYFLTFRKLRQWVGVEKEALAYLVCKAQYDTTQASEDLSSSGIEIPPFNETLRPMVSYYKDHKTDPEKKFVIM
ncbi:SDR family oxidoreductase [Alteribacter aurantiacus]|uniref:SDR family oxidoreductase n=1 Tax=Alteribacter aurantiacus TaxID=254410 RepID=UPI00042484B5|nr:SDR family oxidoreductase [Alteribacter aurantiacus]